jgi:hypothetical protein
MSATATASRLIQSADEPDAVPVNAQNVRDTNGPSERLSTRFTTE